MIRLKVKFDTAYFLKECLVGSHPMRVISSQTVTHTVIEIDVPDGKTKFINSYATNIEVLSRTYLGLTLEEGKVYKCKNCFYYKCISGNGNTKLLRHDDTIVSTSLDALDLTEYTLDNFISEFVPHVSKTCNPLHLFPNVSNMEQAKILALFI